MPHILYIKPDLNEKSPCCLHGHGDEAGDGVSQDEMEDKEVNIGPAPDVRPAGLFAGCQQGHGVENHTNFENNVHFDLKILEGQCTKTC